MCNYQISKFYTCNYTYLTHTVHKYCTQTTHISHTCRCCNPFDQYWTSVWVTNLHFSTPNESFQCFVHLQLKTVDMCRLIQHFAVSRLSTLAVCTEIILRWLSIRGIKHMSAVTWWFWPCVVIPQGWGVEVHTLKIQRNWQEFHPNQVKDRNVLLVKVSPEVTLYLHIYKTAKFFGHQSWLWT